MSGMNAVDVLNGLKVVRELLSVESRWTQKAEARNAAGFVVDPSSKNAIKWDLLGACRKVAGVRDAWPLIHRLDDAIWKHIGRGVTLESLNDLKGHKEVIRLLDLALKELAVELASTPVKLPKRSA
jgi:hypothetical protein